jgi:hypothetical protein
MTLLEYKGALTVQAFQLIILEPSTSSGVNNQKINILSASGGINFTG